MGQRGSTSGPFWRWAWRSSLRYRGWQRQDSSRITIRRSWTPSDKGEARMKKYIAGALGLAAALVSLLPGLAAAKIAGNHNQTLLRERAKKHLGAALGLGLALVAALPGFAAAKLAGNHNQTILRNCAARKLFG